MRKTIFAITSVRLSILSLLTILSYIAITVVFANKGYAELSQNHTPNVYQEVFIEELLNAEKSQDGKEVILTRLIESSKGRGSLANLYCRRGKLRVTHTHLPKGIEDLQTCIDTLAVTSNENKTKIVQTQQELDHARLKYVSTKRLSESKDKNLIIRFTALWKLGRREQAVKVVKAEAIPEKFNTLSTNRMVKAGYLCEGNSPNGPEKSFRTKKTGPFWWCDELEG